MKHRIRIEPEASAELEDAIRWYDQQYADLGAEFLSAVDATIALVDRWPDAAPAVPQVAEEIPARRAPVPRFPYGIIYLLVDDAILDPRLRARAAQAELLADSNRCIKSDQHRLPVRQAAASSRQAQSRNTLNLPARMRNTYKSAGRRQCDEGHRKWRDTDHLERAVETAGGPEIFEDEVQRLREYARGWRLAELRERRD